MAVPQSLRWTFGLAITAIVTIVPFLDYRWHYTHSKRLREVDPGRFYRSGQLTAPGFADACQRFHFRTIVNLQEDVPDPDIALAYFTSRTMKESELCRQLGVRYVFLAPDTVPPRQRAYRRPEAIDHFLALLDDPNTYPVLIHCRAGLHRTGVLSALYRMEYNGWTRWQALAELKANGFGEWPCSTSNDYIADYVLDYHPGLRRASGPFANAAPAEGKTR